MRPSGFFSAVYDIDGYLILHSGRPVPGEGVKVERNEGVAVVLDPCMVKNWKDGGEVWEPVSSRVVSARLKLSDGLEGRVSGKKCPVYCSDVSVYAPTHRASQEDKDHFFDDLQRVLDGISADDVLLIMGDLNARVGAEDDGGAWDGVCGRHGVGCRNESGEALLSWCALNGLVVMNTMFEKKKIHKYTWQHPRSKQWHCIDYVIMRQRQRGLCCDVSVLRAADCWTDHKLLRAQLRVGCRVVKKASAITRRRCAVGALQDEMMRKAFVEKVCGTVESCWDDGLSGAGMWEVIRDGMVSAAEGWETRRQPHWFNESTPVLKELIDRRNLLFGRWLRSGRNSDRQKYVDQRRVVAKAVRKAKSKWLEEQAREVEFAMLSGGSKRSMWSSLREIQRGRAGLRPVRSKVIRKANGELCAGPEESLSHWQEHFSAVLNMTSCFSNGIFHSVKQLPLREELDLPPSADEVLAALRGNKAGGKNGLLPELWKCCGANLLEHLVELFHQIWQDGCVPQEWKDALIVPIKKGDLSLCDNWRGISLLDVGGKMFAKIIQQRLQTVVEEVLPDSQCGFRSGRGCVDMIYCARQLVEKAIEHNTKIFMLFIDLRKAYDSISRQALWCALKKCGIPQSMLKVICSLHDGMRAEVIIDGQVAPEFEVSNGLRQGCVTAPTLFISTWRLSSGEVSVVYLELMFSTSVEGTGWREDKEALTDKDFRASFC